jgi:hypothetical protein
VQFHFSLQKFDLKFAASIPPAPSGCQLQATGGAIAVRATSSGASLAFIFYAL